MSRIPETDKARKWVWMLWLTGSVVVHAQIDPQERQLFQVGYNQPVQGREPLSGYAFYYRNVPNYPGTNQTLRLALAPIYLDSELGFAELLGPGTDLAVGLAGGGFADSYSEFRGGKYWPEESFLGHGGEISASVYHCFNPGARIPLNGIVRSAVHYSAYETDYRTPANFQLPPDRLDFHGRVGVRWGGQEPLLNPAQGLELSLWHETQRRGDAGYYGLGGDREVRSASYLFWARAAFAYTLPESGHYLNLSLMAGTAVSADRFSAFRVGGWLPFSSEFALNLPGYYLNELSATRFGLLNGQYSFPIDSLKHWNITLFSGGGWVDYLPDLAQPGRWHAGVGGGLTYRPPSQVWQVVLGCGYGLEAMRSHGRGAEVVGLMVQLDLEAKRRAAGEIAQPAVSPHKSRGFDWLFHR
jgi:hypothetical protein